MSDNDSDHSPEELGLSKYVDRRTLMERALGVGVTGALVGGATGAASATDLPNELILESLTESARVRVEVSGEIEKGRFTEDSDTVEDGHVAISRLVREGAVDRWRFSGEVLRFEILEGDVDVKVNGEDVDPSTLGFPNELIIESLSETARVRIEVTGEIVKGRFTEDSDTVEDGYVAISRFYREGGGDRWLYSGNVVGIAVPEGNVEIDFVYGDH